MRGCTPHYNSKEVDHRIPEQQLKAIRLGNTSFTYRECDPQYVKGSDSDFYDPYQSDHVKTRLKQSHWKGSSTGDLEAIVQTGDVLYHPAGVWHKVECLEDSITINISMIASSMAEIFCSNLQQLLCSDNDDFWRRPPDLRNPEVYFETLNVHIKKLVNEKGFINDVVARDILPKPTITIAKTHQYEDNEEEDERDEDEKEDDVRTDANVMTLDASLCSMKNFCSVGNFSEMSKQYKFNPCAILLPEDCLYNSQSSDCMDTRRWIINVGYGNESLESISRTIIKVIHADMNELRPKKKSSNRMSHLIDFIHETCQKHKHEERPLTTLSVEIIKTLLQEVYSNVDDYNPVYIHHTLHTLYEAGYLTPIASK